VFVRVPIGTDDMSSGWRSAAALWPRLTVSAADLLRPFEPELDRLRRARELAHSAPSTAARGRHAAEAKRRLHVLQYMLRRWAEPMVWGPPLLTAEREMLAVLERHGVRLPDRLGICEECGRIFARARSSRRHCTRRCQQARPFEPECWHVAPWTTYRYGRRELEAMCMECGGMFYATRSDKRYCTRCSTPAARSRRSRVA
jgi:hypothetical protein